MVHSTEYLTTDPCNQRPLSPPHAKLTKKNIEDFFFSLQAGGHINIAFWGGGRASHASQAVVKFPAWLKVTMLMLTAIRFSLLTALRFVLRQAQQAGFSCREFRVS